MVRFVAVREFVGVMSGALCVIFRLDNAERSMPKKVKHAPWSVHVGRDHADTVNGVHDVLEAIRVDKDVSGVVVIIQRRGTGTQDMQVAKVGSLGRSGSAVVHYLMRALLHFV